MQYPFLGNKRAKKESTSSFINKRETLKSKQTNIKTESVWILGSMTILLRLILNRLHYNHLFSYRKEKKKQFVLFDELSN